MTKWLPVPRTSTTEKTMGRTYSTESLPGGLSGRYQESLLTNPNSQKWTRCSSFPLADRPEFRRTDISVHKSTLWSRPITLSTRQGSWMPTWYLGWEVPGRSGAAMPKLLCRWPVDRHTRHTASTNTGEDSARDYEWRYIRATQMALKSSTARR